MGGRTVDFGDWVFAVFATVILAVLAVFCWLTSISAVQSMEGELAPAIILYSFNVLVNIGALWVIVKVWRL